MSTRPLFYVLKHILGQKIRKNAKKNKKMQKKIKKCKKIAKKFAHIKKMLYLCTEFKKQPNYEQKLFNKELRRNPTDNGND